MKIETENFDIEIKGSWGYFEHKYLGDECAASLKLEGVRVVDYSGVAVIPNEVANALIEHGAVIGCLGILPRNN